MTEPSRRRVRPLAVLLPEVGLASETFIRRDVNELFPRGTVTVVDPPPGGASLHDLPAWRAEAPTLAFTPLPGDSPPPADRVAALRAFLARNGVRVVLVEYLDFADRWFDHLTALDVRVWLRGHGIDLSARLREPGMGSRYRRFAMATGVIVPSQAAARRLSGLGLPDERIHVVPYGIDVSDHLSPRPPHPAGDVIRCLAVGRLVAKKAPLFTLAAFHQAYCADSRLRLDLVGDGPLASQVRDYVASRGLGRVVRLHGQTPHDHVLSLMRQTDILLHHAVTSPDDGDAEGLPVVVLEAMAAGLPVVATCHEGIREAIEHGRTGLLVAERDVAAMAAAVRDLACSPEMRTAIGRRAWQVARGRYAYPDARSRLLNLLGVQAG